MENPITLDSPGAVRHAVLELALLARQSLIIFTQDLDPLLFDQPSFVRAVRRLAIAHQHARIRILVRHPRRAIKDGHRLVMLARKLTSRMAIRVPGTEHEEYDAAFLVADAAHLLFDPTPGRYTARMLRAARARARELTTFFDQVWEHGQVHPDFRELRL